MAVNMKHTFLYDKGQFYNPNLDFSCLHSLDSINFQALTVDKAIERDHNDGNTVDFNGGLVGAFDCD